LKFSELKDLTFNDLLALTYHHRMDRRHKEYLAFMTGVSVATRFASGDEPPPKFDDLFPETFVTSEEACQPAIETAKRLGDPV
jgi:hypothetical protein